MNPIATIVNAAFTATLWATKRRPVSHAAAAVFVITSNMVAHEGLMAWLPGKLGWALTALFGAVSVLQWLGLGRQDACLDAKDHDRAAAVIQQAWIFGAIETALFAAGVLAIAAADGLMVYSLWPITGALAGAALFAYVNFRVKWVSCDAVSRRIATTSTTHVALFSAPVENLPALEAPAADNVYSFDIEKALRIKHEQDDTLNADLRAAVPPVDDNETPRTASRRLLLTVKRLQTRHRRAAKRAA